MGLLGDRSDVNVWFEKRGRWIWAFAEAEVRGKLLQGKAWGRSIAEAKARAVDDLREKRNARRREIRDQPDPIGERDNGANQDQRRAQDRKGPP